MADLPPSADETPPHLLHRPWLAGLLAAAVALMLALAVTDLPSAAAQLPQVARHAMQIALPRWGQTEVVSEVVYGSRGYDTFGETFLLLAAVLSVVVLSRGREPRSEYVGESVAGLREQAETDPQESPDTTQSTARAAERREADEEPASDEPAATPDAIPLGTPAPDRAEAMTVVVRTAARTAAPFLLVASIYLAAWGYTPGGGFPAGAALTGIAVLLYGALGRRAISRLIRPNLLDPLEVLGAAGIVTIGVLGLLLNGSMFANFVHLAQPGTIRAGGSEQLYSGAELLEVVTGLCIAIFSLLGMGHDWTPDEDGEQDDAT